MAYNKIEVFSKIGDLLVEINDSYAALSEDLLAQKTTDLILLEAKARYLTAHIEVLQRLADLEKPVQKVDTSFVNSDKPTVETPLTTSLVHEEEEKPTAAEVVATNPISYVAPEFFAPIEEEEESIIAEEEVVVPAEAPVEIPAEAPIAAAFVAAPVVEQVEEAPVEDKVVAEPIPVEQPVVVQKTVIEEPKEVWVETPAPAPVVEEVKPAEPIAPTPIEEPVAVAQEAPARPLTLNEILQQQKKAQAAGGAPMTGTATPERLVDLRSAISLNDKLLFIKDLFNGYSLAYSEAVELLNRYGTFAEADTFLQTNYALKNNWTDKPQTVEKLYAILRKKYM